MWQKLATFITDVRGEFARVTWPTRENLINSTGVVLVFSGAFAVFIGLFDLLISNVMRAILGL